MQGMGNSFGYLCAKNYQHRTWFDSYWPNKKGAVFLPHIMIGCSNATSKQFVEITQKRATEAGVLMNVRN